MKATIKNLIKIYDNAKKIAKVHSNNCEVVINRVCRDTMTDEEFEDKCTKALFLAGLTDIDGCTDVYERERIARENLLSYILSIVPKAEREVLQANRHNVTQMEKVIELARKFAA